MRIRSLFLLTTLGAALAGCGDGNPVQPRTPGAPKLSATATRTIRVTARTVWITSDPFPPSSGGYAKGWATPISSGTGYEMGDVEADGSSADFVEQIGYNGQLDAFSYYRCTYRWSIGGSSVSTSTVYLVNYPNATSATLTLTCRYP